MADSNARTCSVCKDRIINGKLPCNHEFCKTCIGNLEKSENFKCPLCRVSFKDEINQSLDELPNEIQKEENTEKDILCKVHNMTISCWCKECKDIVCPMCSLLLHKKHDVELLEESEDMKIHIMNDVTIIRDESIRDITQAIDLRSKLDKDISIIETFKNEVKQLKINIKAQSEELDRTIMIKEKHSERVSKFQAIVNGEASGISIYKGWMSVKNKSHLNQTSCSALEAFDPTLCSIAYAYQVCNFELFVSNYK